MFHQRPRFPSRLAIACQDIGAGKEGCSTCSSRPSVLTRPTPRGDLGCQHALRCSIHRRRMRSAPANPFPGARTTDRRSIVKQTSVRTPRGVPSFRPWGTVAMSVWGCWPFGAGSARRAISAPSVLPSDNARPERGLSAPMPFFSPAPACCSPAAHEQDEQKDDDEADQDASTLSVKQVVGDHNDVRQRRECPAALSEVPALVKSALPSPSLARCSAAISRSSSSPRANGITAISGTPSPILMMRSTVTNLTPSTTLVPMAMPSSATTQVSTILLSILYTPAAQLTQTNRLRVNFPYCLQYWSVSACTALSLAANHLSLRAQELLF
jgi:hypothetical protein